MIRHYNLIVRKAGEPIGFVPLNDKQMAEKTGLTLYQYATKRKKIEAKINVCR